MHLGINGEEIITTADHPFYVKGRGFVKAGELWAGAGLLDVKGNLLNLEDIHQEFVEESVTVYNLQVEEFHTYYAGAQSVLVHNANYPEDTSGIQEKSQAGQEAEGGTEQKPTEGSSGFVQTISNKFPNDNQAGKKFYYTTENGRIHIENGVQNVDFVIDMDGNLHIGRGHSNLAGGNSVQAAGTMKVNAQGYIRLITNESGHFQPTTAQAMNYPTVFTNAGLNINNAWIKIGEFETSMSNYVIDLKVIYNGLIKNMP